MASLSRYRNLNVLSGSFNGVNLPQYYETSEFPSIQQLAQIPTIQVMAGQFERLDNLAAKYLGDGTYWWVIALYNGLDWPYSIPPSGSILSIPSNLNDFLKLF